MIAKYVYHVCLYKVTTDAKVIFVTVNLQNKIWPHESQTTLLMITKCALGTLFSGLALFQSSPE